MRARGIDTVTVVGDPTIAVNTFIGEGYFPTLFFLDQGAANTTAGNTDMSVFPAVYTYGNPTAGCEADLASPAENPPSSAQSPKQLGRISTTKPSANSAPDSTLIWNRRSGS